MQVGYSILNNETPDLLIQGHAEARNRQEDVTLQGRI